MTTYYCCLVTMKINAVCFQETYAGIEDFFVFFLFQYMADDLVNIIFRGIFYFHS